MRTSLSLRGAQTEGVFGFTSQSYHKYGHFFEQKNAARKVNQITHPRIQGTGFFVSTDGLAVSNYYVFEGTSIGLESIQTQDGKSYKVDHVVKQRKQQDYIIFQVAIEDYDQVRPIPVATTVPKVGEDVFAIGNPRGLNSTLSKGIISAHRSADSQLQTTAEITHGSSGGPLIIYQGQVVGITTSGYGEANLNFAVDIQVLDVPRYLK